MKRSILLTLLPALVASAPAATTIETFRAPIVRDVAPDHPAKAATEAFNDGREAEAVRLAEPLAEAGNGVALRLLAIAYDTGRGVAPSRDKAIEYYRKAKGAGDKGSAHRLARLLIDTGNEEAREEAKGILEDLATNEDGSATLLLGEGALQGWFGEEPDFDKARSLWTAAAKQEDTEAMLILGRLLDGALGFPERRDAAAALEQFEKAAALGNSTAMVAAGVRRLNGDESLRNEKLGREWLVKAIEKGQYDACVALGDFEQFVRKDTGAAVEHYRLGAENGQADCMLRLGDLILEGAGGVEKDSEEALVWFKKAGKAGSLLGHSKAARVLLEAGDDSRIFEAYTELAAAAEAGLANAQNGLGVLYLSGRLGPRDPTAAAAWFGRAAAVGFPQAARNLGALHERGLGVPQNFDLAGRLYTSAASAGDAEAMTALAGLLTRGLGTAKDLPKAWATYSLAAELGDSEAKPLLDDLTRRLTDGEIDKGRLLLAEMKQKPGAGAPEDQE